MTPEPSARSSANRVRPAGRTKKENPFRLTAKRVFSVREGNVLHEFLELFPGHKLDGFGGLDFDFFAGLGVHSNPGLAAGNLEGAETDQLNGFGFFDPGLDAVDHGIHSPLGVGLAGSEVFLHRYDEFNFVHEMFWKLEI